MRSVLSLVYPGFTTALLSLLMTAVWTTQSRSEQQPSVVTFERGYLFIDGNYVEPPYRIEASADTLRVNGKEYSKAHFDLADEDSETAGPGFGNGRKRFGNGPGRFEDRGRGADFGRGAEFGRGGRRPGGMRGRSGDGPSGLERVESQLDMANYGAMIALDATQKPLVIYPNQGGKELLLTLLGQRAENAEKPSRLDANEIAAWDQLVSSFQPTERFRDLALSQLAKQDMAESEGEKTSAANLLLARISYPLTVFAMVVVVLGFGHLLSNRPDLEDASDDHAKRRQVVIKSLVIIAMLSVVDLIWTLSASSAGAMRELNPLGSRMISDPTTLTLFKILVTGTSIGILYSLKRRPVAQLASWWCCLLLTLLTARWVVLQSLFV